MVASSISFWSFTNSVVAHALWECWVSHGSVETIFRRGGKRLYNLAANLFRKLSTKFHQNRPNFVEDITNKHSGLFFSSHSVYLYEINDSSKNRISPQKNQWTDLHQIWQSGSPRWPNHPLYFFWQSAYGFWFCEDRILPFSYLQALAVNTVLALQCSLW